MDRYFKGQEVRIDATFTAGGNLQDPTTVVFKYKTPAGTTTTLTYGVDGALVRDSLGKFHVDVLGSTTGEWPFRFEGTGTCQAAYEGEFWIKASEF